MILVNEAGVVVAQSDNIITMDKYYKIDSTLFNNEGLTLYDMNVPEDMVVGRCTYINEVFEALPEPEPEPEIPIDYTLEETKEIKVQELSDTCNAIISNGTDVTLSDGTVQHFTLTEQDQLNLSGLGLKLMMGVDQVAWHEDDESKSCQYYSAQDAQIIIGTLTTFKEYHITYFRDLRIYVNSLTTVEEVNAITYGFSLPEEFKSQVLKDFELVFAGGVAQDEDNI